MARFPKRLTVIETSLQKSLHLKADRSLVELGRLEVTAISPTSAADECRLVFDPTNLTDGIALSADPILLVRSTAYSISYDERSQGA